MLENEKKSLILIICIIQISKINTIDTLFSQTKYIYFLAIPVNVQSFRYLYIRITNRGDTLIRDISNFSLVIDLPLTGNHSMH